MSSLYYYTQCYITFIVLDLLSSYLISVFTPTIALPYDSQSNCGMSKLLKQYLHK
jgi:hypothetical protein